MSERWKGKWKPQRFGFQCTAAEKKALEHIAEEDGEWNLSAVVRNLIREEARRRGFWPPKEEGGGSGGIR